MGIDEFKQQLNFELGVIFTEFEESIQKRTEELINKISDDIDRMCEELK